MRNECLARVEGRKPKGQCSSTLRDRNEPSPHVCRQGFGSRLSASGAQRSWSQAVARAHMSAVRGIKTHRFSRRHATESSFGMSAELRIRNAARRIRLTRHGHREGTGPLTSRRESILLPFWKVDRPLGFKRWLSNPAHLCVHACM